MRAVIHNLIIVHFKRGILRVSQPNHVRPWVVTYYASIINNTPLAYDDQLN